MRKKIWSVRKTDVSLHRLPKGYGYRELEPHDPKAIGSRGHYKFARKVSPTLRVSVGRFHFLTLNKQHMDEETYSELDEVLAKAQDLSKVVKDGYTVLQAGSALAYECHSQVVRAHQCLRALRAMNV